MSTDALLKEYSSGTLHKPQISLANQEHYTDARMLNSGIAQNCPQEDLSTSVH